MNTLTDPPVPATVAEAPHPPQDPAPAAPPAPAAGTPDAGTPDPRHIRVRRHRAPPGRLSPPGRRPDRPPQLPMAHETYRYLSHRASLEHSRLVQPMRQLMLETGAETVRVFLCDMGVDAFDIWIAYHLLSSREQSRSGRDACGWLAETLGQVLRTRQPHRRDKAGALLLWAVLHLSHRDNQRGAMYRNAMALMIPGRDRFLLSEGGPRPLSARRDPPPGDMLATIARLIDEDGPEAEHIAGALASKLQQREQRRREAQAQALAAAVAHAEHDRDVDADVDVDADADADAAAALDLDAAPFDASFGAW